MFRLFFTPEWFQGWDLGFQAVSLVIGILIALYSWKMYKVTGENKFAYFSGAFVFIAIGFVANIITQGLVYFSPFRTVAMNVLIPVVGRATTGVNYSQLFFRAGFFVSMVATLGAWLLIFFVSQKRSGRLKNYYDVSQIALFIYLIVLISVVSNFTYFVFYLTSLVILGMNVLNYYKNYLNTRNKNAKSVLTAFITLLVGHLFFVFVFLFPSFYVFGQIFVMIGFLMLLSVYSRVTK